MTKLLILTMSLALISACASKPAVTPANATNGVKLMPATQLRAEDLLVFCNDFSELNTETQKKMWQETQLSLQQNKNNITSRIKQAAMLALPASKLRDTAKAQNLLQELLRENTLNPQDNALVGLLYEYTVEQQRLGNKLRDEAKKTEMLQQKNETLQQKNETLLQKNESLQIKLDELRKLEKTLLNRDKAVEGKTP